MIYHAITNTKKGLGPFYHDVLMPDNNQITISIILIHILTESALLPVDEAELFDRLYKKLESEDNWYLLLDANVSLKLIPKKK